MYGYALDEYADFARDMYEIDNRDNDEVIELEKKLDNIKEFFSHLESILKSPLALDMDSLYTAIEEINFQLGVQTDDSTIKIARAVYPRPQAVK